MTGFAVQTRDIPAGTLTLELRGVNARFLDLSFRIGEDFRVLEPVFRERIADSVRRGKLECRAYFTASATTRGLEVLNTPLLGQLREVSERIRQQMPGLQAMSVSDVLRWPGLLEEVVPDPEFLHAAALELMNQALKEFNASRAREGAKLKAVILDRVAAMRQLASGIRPKVPDIVAAYRDKLDKRMTEILRSPDSERILQEVAFFAQKIDVDEELDRLTTHLDEIERVLNQGSPAGKRLDFLMQELNREANTLGSKSVTLEFSQASVECKVLIEQMREQVQNLE